MALEDKSITTPEALSKALAEKNIETRYNTNKNGISGVSFRHQEVAVKGSEIQHKANYIVAKLEENKAIQMQSITQVIKGLKTLSMLIIRHTTKERNPIPKLYLSKMDLKKRMICLFIPTMITAKR